MRILPRGKVRASYSVRDPREFPHISTPAIQLRGDRFSEKNGTYVSLTPQRFGHFSANSVITSESRSMPPLAPGSLRIHEKDRRSTLDPHLQLYIITGIGLFSATSVQNAF